MWKCLRFRSFGYGEVPFIPSWGAIIPHSEAAQGAQAFNSTYTEYIYGTIMVPMMDIPFTFRDKVGIKGAARILKEQGVNASIEPHFNAFNGRVKGAEMLVLSSDGLSKHYAELFLDIFKEDFPERRIRGVKEVSPGDRGYTNLLKCKQAGMKVAILSELFFGDNNEDWLAPDEQAKYWRSCLGSDIDNKDNSWANIVSRH